MTKKPRQQDPARAAIYLPLYPGIKRIAWEFGYAAMVHGSLTTDMDVLLVPWVKDAKAEADVVEAIRIFLGGIVKERDKDRLPEKKPHGRLAWSFYLNQQTAEAWHYEYEEPYVDVSVMPRVCP